jgi:hypothetical protein
MKNDYRILTNCAVIFDEQDKVIEAVKDSEIKEKIENLTQVYPKIKMHYYSAYSIAELNPNDEETQVLLGAGFIKIEE